MSSCSISTWCRLSRQEAAAQANDPVYDAEERVFVRQLADWVSARADVLEAYAKDIPKFAAEHFN